MHRIVGLDIAQESLRFVALESGFRGFKVLEARELPLPGAASEGATRGERLRLALQPLGLGGPDDSVAVALPSTQVASHLFTLPFTDPRRIEQVLPAEVEGAIPFEIDEVIWDHAVLSQADGKSQVLVAVTQKSVLEAALAELKAAGVEPRAVTFAPMALAALAERGMLAPAAEQAEPGELGEGLRGSGGGSADARPILILEAGPERASATAVSGEKGETIELARSLSAAPGPLWSAAEAGEPAALDRLLEPMARDLKLALRARGLSGAKGPARAQLTGALAALPGVSARLAELLAIPCAPLLLAEAAALPAGADPAALGVAFALALRAQHSRGHINFRKGAHAFTKDLSQARGQVVRLGVALAVVLALALAYGLARLGSLARQNAAYDDALCAATKKVLGDCLTDYRMAVSRMSGSSSKAGGIPRASANQVLAEVLKNLPEASLPMLDDLEVTTTSVRVKGVADSYAQVSEIVAALKTDKCMGEIKQPRTEKVRDSQKISFTFDFPYVCSGESSSTGS